MNEYLNRARQAFAKVFKVEPTFSFGADWFDVNGLIFQQIKIKRRFLTGTKELPGWDLGTIDGEFAVEIGQSLNLDELIAIAIGEYAKLLGKQHLENLSIERMLAE